MPRTACSPRPALRRLLPLLLQIPLAVSAGRPFLTEDAGVLERGGCEWESVAAHSRGSETTRSLGTQLACGLGSGLQLGAQLNQQRGAGEHLLGSGLVGKWELAVAGDSALSLAGASSWRHPRGAGTDWEGASLMAVLSQGLGRGWTAHANLGGSYSRAEGRWRSGWAVLVERSLGASLEVGAELFGEARERPGWGLGARWRPAEAWSLDVGLSRSGGRPRERLLSLGLKREF